jgi:hypothetical protein
MKPSATRLSEGLCKRLEAYALAATAAGTGFLVSAPLSEAQVANTVVYTPVNVSIAPNTSYAVDLNHDGIVDFTIVDKRGYTTYGELTNRVYVVPAPGASVAWSYYPGSAAVVPPKAKINRNLQWSRCAGVYASPSCQMQYVIGSHSTYFGRWNEASGYLGLAFRINGRVHYGWARMSVSYDYITNTLLTSLGGFAYERLAGKPIIAGDKKSPPENDPQAAYRDDSATQNPTLGMLAAGATGLGVWRKHP